MTEPACITSLAVAGWIMTPLPVSVLLAGLAAAAVLGHVKVALSAYFRIV